jgi:hypothetical protein
MSRKRFPLFRLTLGFVLTSSAAQATFVTFTINPANLNERALVAEQIYLIPGGYDYEFLVANIGTVGINGFYGGIGNFAVAVAGGQWVGTAAGGADPPRFPASAIGGAFGPLLTGAAGATNPYSAVPFNSWGFEQFDDRLAQNALPNTSYVVRWFNTGLTGPLPPGFFTRFDLFSAFGPSPGGGGVDPPTGDVFFGLEDTLGNAFTLDTSNPNLTINSCNPNTDTNCSGSTIPANFNGDSAFGLPEPATWLLMAAGLPTIWLLRRRRNVG